MRCVSCGGRSVRYVYASMYRGQPWPDDSFCATCGGGHAVREVPWADYGIDHELIVGAVEDHVSGRRTCALPECRAMVRRHTHATPKVK
jgi:hypothetical protein